MPWPTRSKATSTTSSARSVSTRHPSRGEAYTSEIAWPWHETDRLPPATVHVLTTALAVVEGAAGAVLVVTEGSAGLTVAG
jgi:hypothetical protein